MIKPNNREHICHVYKSFQVWAWLPTSLLFIKAFELLCLLCASFPLARSFISWLWVDSGLPMHLPFMCVRVYVMRQCLGLSMHLSFHKGNLACVFVCLWREGVRVFLCTSPFIKAFTLFFSCVNFACVFLCLWRGSVWACLCTSPFTKAFKLLCLMCKTCLCVHVSCNEGVWIRLLLMHLSFS